MSLKGKHTKRSRNRQNKRHLSKKDLRFGMCVETRLSPIESQLDACADPPRCQEWKNYHLGDLAIQRLCTWPLKSRVSVPVPRKMSFSRPEVNVATVL